MTTTARGGLPANNQEQDESQSANMNEFGATALRGSDGAPDPPGRFDEPTKLEGSCHRCRELEGQTRSLQAQNRVLSETAVSAVQEASLLRDKIGEMVDDTVRDHRIAAENERLVDVIHLLKSELDRQPVAPEILEELLNVKMKLVTVALERDELLEKVKRHSCTIETNTRRRGRRTAKACKTVSKE